MKICRNKKTEHIKLLYVLFFYSLEEAGCENSGSIGIKESTRIAYVTAKKDLTFLFNNICYNRIVTGNEMIGEHYE